MPWNRKGRKIDLWLCRGEGREKLKKEIEIKIPSGVKSGMVMRNRINLDGKEKDLFITLKVQSF